ncbi:cryptochrome/photolyase family protein [Fulvivirga sp. RKSG066]|uniref:cryptochrome/photolyase family protein n=1 Tax=Fulvivirga aurantia TaxID=2529383 RepID=UPI0012BD2EDC|nr:cryptochrome/photolyase family protein [Fulvivirga aurantia]MTI20542.1 cryptochrome/photolyase family protein [Fulvivirga aurantia]
MKIALVFPHQLYKNNPAVNNVDEILLIEDHLYFSQYKFHKQKLVLHRASMKYYQNYLQQKDQQVRYIECNDHESLQSIFEDLEFGGADTIIYTDTTDYNLEKSIQKACDSFNVKCDKKQTPAFLTSLEELEEILPKGKEGYYMATFYKKQRKRLDVLMDNGEPEGGKWSYDDENRKKLPKDHETPEIYIPQKNEYLKEALEHVEKEFTDNYGSLENFIYPITHYQAEKWLDDFLEHRMTLFGDYEDALHSDEKYIYHSLLTPALNTGLLTPEYVLNRTFEMHQKHNYPLNCLEGFVRQIIGWREFMRGIYEFEGVFERTNNHWNHDRKIPKSFWDGTTGIKPVDDVIKKVLNNGYNHHIERLMVMGNFMLLCEFDPDEIYRWFMEMYIDAYDWVMVPNVYGMTQYADGGLITTKPYISSSNYIRKMSNYGKDDWCETWDALYWRFIKVHEEEFSNNQRMGMMISLLNRMDKDTLQNHLDKAESFLKSIMLRDS